MSALQTVVASSRPKFLVLSVVCIGLAWAGSISEGFAISWWISMWVVVGGVAAHIGVNLLNEYEDFQSGLDLITVKTPFSGGSGALVEKPEFASKVLACAMFSLLLTVAVGCYLVYLRGVALLIIGILGMMLIVSYTRYINRNALLCLIAPGIGFGVLMVMGSAIALSGHVSAAVAWLSLPAFFLVNNLLLLNQFPDVDADQQVGRYHFIIRYGRVISSRVYIFFMICAYFSIGLAVVLAVLPVMALLSMPTLVIALPTARGVLFYARDPQRLNAFLGPNIAITVATLAILAVTVAIESGS
jgi:1,4-dihydroxy-2-naphthoate octaprenyltransferase